MIIGHRPQSAASAGELEESRQRSDQGRRDQRRGQVLLVDQQAASKQLLEQEHRILGQPDIDAVDVIAENRLPQAVEEIGDPQRGHQQRDALLVDQFAQTKSLDRPGHRDHHQHRATEGQQVDQQLPRQPRPLRNPLGETRHRQRREQDHRALGKVEHAAGLVDQHKTQCDQRIKHACHQAADQCFQKRSHIHAPVSGFNAKRRDRR